MTIAEYDNKMLKINNELSLLEEYLEIANKNDKNSSYDLIVINQDIHEYFRLQYQNKINEREALIASQIPF